MHWAMWIFWGSLAALIVGGYLVDLLTKRKYNFKDQKKTLNQNTAEADSLRAAEMYNHQNGMF